MKKKPTALYRWPAYMPQGLRRRLRVHLARNGITFSEWVRKHAEQDLKA